MEFLLLALALLVVAYFIYISKSPAPVVAKPDPLIAIQSKQLEQARLELQKAFTEMGQVQSNFSAISNQLTTREYELTNLKEAFQKLQHQKISADVRVGQKTEQILPFLNDFPYKDEEIRGLFNPVDLIVFGEDHITFVEVKTGNAPISEKQ